MNTFRGLKMLYWTGLISVTRSRAALFWTLAFPAFFLFVFGFVFGGSPGGATYLMPGLWTITVISATFFGTSMTMVTERENGTFRRYHVTPVTPQAIVTAFGLVQATTLVLSLILQGVLAWLVFKVDPQGPIYLLLPVFAAGIFAFTPLGLIVGSISRDMKTAPVVSNLLFFPLMFLSGAAVPFFMLPDAVQKIARLLPSTYLVEALQGVMVRGESLGKLSGPIAVLVLTGVVGFTLNTLLFRWESTDPVNRRNLAIALGGLALIYAAAALFGPELRMRINPS